MKDINEKAYESLYQPSPWQAEFHSREEDEVLGAGAAGPGKSLCLLMDPMHQIILEHKRMLLPPGYQYKIPKGGSRGWALHLRRESPMLADTIVRSQRIFKQIDPGANFSKDSLTWEFSSGYRFEFGHCRDLNDWQRYFSREFTHVAPDELIQFEKVQYEQITGRCRSSDPLLSNMLKIRAMSNPMQVFDVRMTSHVSDPTWVRERFVAPAPKGRKVIKQKLERGDGTIDYWTRLYLPATLYDNPDPAFVKNYEKTLLSRSKHVQRALLYGDWYAVAGGFYSDDWMSDIHVVKPFEIPEHWPRFRSMDWGYKSPGVMGWWAMDPDGNLICEKEVTFIRQSVDEVADTIEDMEKWMGLWSGGRSQITGPADDQLWEERGDTGLTKAEVFSRRGIDWIPADKKSRITNAQRLLVRLRDHDGGTTAPGIVFFENCTKCIQTIPAIVTDPRNIECPMDGGEDHWHDMVLYACAFASRGPVGIPSRIRDDDWIDDEYERRGRFVGKYGYGT